MIASPNDLTYFLELSETLNFTRASERIGISQPSLSAAIKRLEHAIGTELFIRTKTGVHLTQGGKRLLAHAKELMQLWDTVKSASIASHKAVQGSYTFGCHPSVALYCLSGFLPKLLQAHPKLEIQLKHDLSRKILEGIINLSIDIGIIVNPIRHPDLIIQKLDNDKVTFWHAKDMDNVRETIQSGDALVICDPTLLQTESLLKQAHKEGFRYRRLIQSSSLEVIADLTANGAGIGILPSSVALSIQPNALQETAKMPTFLDEICLVYRHENRGTMALQTMIQAIKTHFNSQKH